MKDIGVVASLEVATTGSAKKLQVILFDDNDIELDIQTRDYSAHIYLTQDDMERLIRWYAANKR